MCRVTGQQRQKLLPLPEGLSTPIGSVNCPLAPLPLKHNCSAPNSPCFVNCYFLLTRPLTLLIVFSNSPFRFQSCSTVDLMILQHFVCGANIHFNHFEFTNPDSPGRDSHSRISYHLIAWHKFWHITVPKMVFWINKGFGREAAHPKDMEAGSRFPGPYSGYTCGALHFHQWSWTTDILSIRGRIITLKYLCSKML